jgi:LacI family transcriptional regulator
MGIARERLQGYRSAIVRRGLRAHKRYIVAGGHGDDTGYAGMQQLLRLSPIPDGVFCYNDPVAIGAIKAVLEDNLEVPGDIAVVGAGNVHFSDALAVPLTTVDQGTSQIGSQAAELLIAQMADKECQKRATILIPPTLVVRESTRR